MPLYSYRCNNSECSKGDFEVRQSMTDSPLEKCPECGEKPTRLITKDVGIFFKGHGFYINDKDK